MLGVLKVWLHTYNPKPFSKIPLYFARHFWVLLISKKVKNNTGRKKSIGKSVYSDMKWAPRTGGKTLIQRPDQADQRRGPKTQQNDQEAFLLGKILEEEKVLLNCSAPEVAILCRGHHGQEEEEVTQMTPGCSDLLLFFDFTIWPFSKNRRDLKNEYFFLKLCRILPYTSKNNRQK